MDDDLDSMRRSDLIQEVRKERRRTLKLTRRKDKLKNELVQANKLYTDKKRAIGGKLKAIKAAKRELLQQLQQEVAKGVALRQQVQERDQTDKDTVDCLKQELKRKLEQIKRQNTCSICLSQWEDGVGVHRVVSLHCGHLFGDKCIRQHLMRHSNCPLCKQAAQVPQLRYIYGYCGL